MKRYTVVCGGTQPEVWWLEERKLHGDTETITNAASFFKRDFAEEVAALLNGIQFAMQPSRQVEVVGEDNMGLADWSHEH